MEPSNDECPLGRLPQSSFGSRDGLNSLDCSAGVSPISAQRKFPGSTGAYNLSGGTSNTFAENLRTKLSFLPMQGDSKRSNQMKRDYRRRSYRFSPYSRSRSLCSISVEPRNLVRRHASQNGIQKTVSMDQGLYACKPSLTRGMSPLVENIEMPAVKEKLKMRSASLRKAASLRKLSETHFDNIEELIPTEPSTPDRIIPSHIPIISPPLPDNPSVLPSAETVAKIRLGKYKEREGRTADYDHARSLQVVDKPWSGSSREWEILLGLGQRTRRRRIDWILQFLPRNTHSASSSFSSTSSTISSSSFSPFDQSMEGLIDQLKTSPETRFHTAWMFLRYHYLMGVGRICGKSVTLDQLPLYPSCGTWDVTLACLAISVKFHRDFLHPLVPVEAVDYMQISPHDMGYEDFEYAQRTVLDAFDYKLGVTPQPFLDQVWVALPSLRALFDFEGGWNQVKKRAWWLLYYSLYEPDVLRFPVSILTATALSRAIIPVLALQYYCEADWNSTLNYPSVAEGEKWNFMIPNQFRDRARGDADGVIMDIETMLGVCDIQMKECRSWFQARNGPELTL